MQLNNDLKINLYNSMVNSNNLGSIVNITGKNLIDSVGNVDLITYSFPCQDLSVSGSFHGFNQGMAKGSGTRSSLLWEIERILFELNSINKLPQFLLLENVKNMLSAKHIKQYHLFLSSLKKLGYSTKTFLLNAKDFGIPQNRERVYALSILNYQGRTNEYGEITNFEYDLNKTILNKKTLKNIIKEDYSNPIYLQEALDSQPNRTKSRKVMFDKNRKLNDYQNYQISRTVTTKQDRHPNAGVVDLRNKEHFALINNKAKYRFITPREAYLLMGFEEKDFDLVINNSLIKKEKLLQQAGNSIVVNVMVSIMELIQRIFNGE